MSNTVKLEPKTVSWPYLEFDDRGRAKIANSRIRISMLIHRKQAHGWSPEEIYFQHPELSLAHVYAAFSYYYTHQSEVDREIAQSEEEILRLKGELKAMGAGYDAAEFRKMLQEKATSST